MSSAVRQSRVCGWAGVAIPVGLTAAAVALAGCSGGRVVDPSLTATAAPAGFIQLRDPAAGVAVGLPRNWTLSPGKGSLLAVDSSGAAVISLWRYPSTAATIPASPAQLRVALGALEHAARAADPSLRIQATGTTQLDGAGAVILDATETIHGQLRRVRSEHAYLSGAELVLETYAPPGQFTGLDHTVFSPVRKSLRLLDAGQPGPGRASTTTTPTATPQA